MLTLQPGDIFAEHYRLTRLIDTGGFADVWEAIFLSAGNTVALKIYPRLDEEGVKNIEDEYRNQADLSHSHLLIARYFGKHNGYPFLEMRYCSGGNASAKVGSSTETDIAKCLCDISSALQYLHENNIVHQDIKPNNFLLDSNGNYYLADMGLSLKVRKTIKKFTRSATAQKSSFTGLTPPAYRSPELYDRTNIGEQPVKATDIWALGASLYEMVTGDMPFGEFGGLNQYKTPDTPPLPAGWSSQLNSIIGKCMAKETWERPKASELNTWAQRFLTTGDYGFSQKTIPVPDPPKPVPKPSRTGLRILIGTVLLAGLIWGINVAINNKPPKPIVVLDSTVKKVDSAIQIRDTTTRTPIKDSTAKPPIVKTPPVDHADLPPKDVAPSVTTISYPAVDGPPKSGLISIAKIERGPSNFKIYFVLRKTSDNDNSTFSIFGPENRNNCFFLIDDDGGKYQLLRISPSGNNLQFGSSRTFPFTATFEKVPDRIRTISIIEGVDRDRMSQNYWTFRNVHLN